MKTLLTTTALALALAMTVGANAAQLAAGPIYSVNATYAFCWWTNLGTGNITPTSQAMYSWTSSTALSIYASCASGSAVVPGQSCYMVPNGGPYDGVSCKVVFNTSAANVRGSLELTDQYEYALSQVELR